MVRLDADLITLKELIVSSMICAEAPAGTAKDPDCWKAITPLVGLREMSTVTVPGTPNDCPVTTIGLFTAKRRGNAKNSDTELVLAASDRAEPMMEGLIGRVFHLERGS